MRLIIISLIGVSSIVLVIMMHSDINRENIREEEISDALVFAMTQTMEELEEKNPKGISNSNEMMALFLQEMIARVNDEISITVICHECNYEEGIMDMEVIGEFMIHGKELKSVSIRRCMKLVQCKGNV